MKIIFLWLFVFLIIACNKGPNYEKVKLYVNIGDIPRAINEYERIISENPTLLEPRRNLIDLLCAEPEDYLRRKCAEEKNTYDRMTNKKPDEPQQQVQQLKQPSLAEIHQHAVDLINGGKFAEAEPILQEIIKNFPNEFLPIYNLAVSSLRQKKFDDADALLNRCLKLNLNFPPAYMAKAELSFLSGKDKEAIKMATKAIELNPKYVEAYKLLSNVQLFVGNHSKAVYTAYSGLKVKTDPELYMVIAKAFASKGNVAMSAFAMDKALALINPSLNFFYNVRRPSPTAPKPDKRVEKGNGWNQNTI